MTPYEALLAEARGRPFAAIVGWPVEHSRSPALHSYWLKKHGIDPDTSEREDLPLWSPGSALARVSIARGLAAGMSFRPAVETARDTLAWWRTVPAPRSEKPMRGGLSDDKEREILADAKG